MNAKTAIVLAVIVGFFAYKAVKTGEEVGSHLKQNPTQTALQQVMQSE